MGRGCYRPRWHRARGALTGGWPLRGARQRRPVSLHRERGSGSARRGQAKQRCGGGLLGAITDLGQVGQPDPSAGRGAGVLWSRLKKSKGGARARPVLLQRGCCSGGDEGRSHPTAPHGRWSLQNRAVGGAAENDSSSFQLTWQQPSPPELYKSIGVNQTSSFP